MKAMRAMAFFKKEWMEALKTPKLLILASTFFLFGLLSPITAKYMNELIAGLGNLDLKLPDPTYMDAYVQLFKNLYSINILIVLMTFMGMVVDEKVKGTAMLVLTKGLSRRAFILSKFFSALIVFTLSYMLAVVACLYYTYLLFPVFFNPGVGVALLLFWIYGALIIALTLCCSTLARSHTMAAVGSFGAFVVVSLTGTLPRLGAFLPGSFQALGMQAVAGTAEAGKAFIPALIALGLMLLVLIVMVASFRQQEI
jgi:ABC-2 type transport system permease protein